MPLTDYALQLLRLAETVHRWLAPAPRFDRKRRLRVAAYAEEIAATLARAGDALQRLEAGPHDQPVPPPANSAASAAISRPSSTCSRIILTDASWLALKGGWNICSRSSCANRVSGRMPIHIDRLASAEGYFRALAERLRT